MGKHWDKIKNEWISVEIDINMFQCETLRVFKRDKVEKIILEMQNELDNLTFIECCLCGEHMELLDNKEYGCSNEDCNNIQRLICKI